MLTAHDVTAEQLVKLVLHEARLLDARDYDAWNRLFTDDAIYWVPLQHDQPDGIDHTSHMYEDKLLRELRIERLKSPRAFSQHAAQPLPPPAADSPAWKCWTRRPTTSSRAPSSTTAKRAATRC